MDARKRIYLKLNLVSLFFIAVSLISVTLAWFAYSGLAKVDTEIDVKTWYIEFQKGEEAVSNNIVISLSDISPGMDIVTEKVKIMNKGDSDAQLSYSIVSASLMGTELDATNGSDYLEDKLSHDYPFHINLSLNKNFALSGDEFSEFNLSVSWPLDSGDDSFDSEWGTRAYQYQRSEQSHHLEDDSYVAKPSIKIVISVKAEQLLTQNSSPDTDYEAGALVLFDVSQNKRCDTLSSTCLRTHVIDTNNTKGDTTVSLLPDLYGTYASGTFDNYNSLLSSAVSGWNVTTRGLTADDLLKVVSKDVVNSIVIGDNVSNRIIGDVKYGSRASQVRNWTVSKNGLFRFNNEVYPYLVTNKCYWTNTEYDNDRGFALTKIDEEYSKEFGQAKTSSCSVAPVIVADKSNLE